MSSPVNYDILTSGPNILQSSVHVLIVLSEEHIHSALTRSALVLGKLMAGGGGWCGGDTPLPAC